MAGVLTGSSRTVSGEEGMILKAEKPVCKLKQEIMGALGLRVPLSLALGGKGRGGSL